MEKLEKNSQKIIGEKIKRTRKEKKITQTELANLINKTPSSIQKYEYGLTSIPFEVLEKIAKVLGKPLSFFLPIPNIEEFVDTVVKLHDKYGTSNIEMKLIDFKNYIYNEMMSRDIEVEEAFEIVENLKKYFDFLINDYKKTQK